MHLNDVPSVMTRVETILIRAARNQESTGPVILHGADGDDVGIARLREPANLAVDFPSGSDRPVIGHAVRAAKRVVRRGLRWYIAPIMEQQTRVNQMLLDVMERLRLQNERLTCEVEALARSLEERDRQGTTAPTDPT